AGRPRSVRTVPLSRRRSEQLFETAPGETNAVPAPLAEDRLPGADGPPEIRWCRDEPGGPVPRNGEDPRAALVQLRLPTLRIAFVVGSDDENVEVAAGVTVRSGGRPEQRHMHRP